MIQESESNTIDLSDDTKCVIYRMVEFLYRGDYQEIDHPDYQTLDKDIIDRSGAHHAVLHASMFAVADKYDIAALGDLAKEKFDKAIENIDNQHYMDVINHVYSTTPESYRGLRDKIGHQTRIRGSTIRTDPVLNSRLEEIVSTTRQFAWDLIQSSFMPTSAKTCTGCNSNLGDKISCSACVQKNQTGGLFGLSSQSHDTPGGAFGRFSQSHDTKNAHASPPSRGTGATPFATDPTQLVAKYYKNVDGGITYF